MRYDKQQISAKLLRWEAFLKDFRLPEWEDLPVIELYMDQVIALINNYLGFFSFEGNDEKLLTASMVNNYVKMKLLPAPVKKKYARKHIACLIMLCTYKQAMSIAVVQKMLPPDDEPVIRRDYEKFVETTRRLALYFTQQVKSSASSVFDQTSNTGTEVSDLVIGSAVSASFAKLLTGKIIALQLPQTPVESKKSTVPNEEDEKKG